MSDVDTDDELVRARPLVLVDQMPEMYMVPVDHNHGPGEHCFFCPCNDCCRFYGRGVHDRCVEPMEVAEPRYGDMEFVKTMRAAAAKREEDRQDKLRAERERAASAAEAAKNDKSSTDQSKKKTLRSSVKRRRV